VSTQRQIRLETACSQADGIRHRYSLAPGSADQFAEKETPVSDMFELDPVLSLTAPFVST
jgi:hypothetical protein